MAQRRFDITFILALLVGAFLVLDGISELSAASSLGARIASEARRLFGGEDRTLVMIIAVVEIVAGALLVLGLFLDIGQLRSALGVGLFIVWLVIIVLTFVVRGFAPDSLAWWTGLVQYLIILTVIWLVKGRRRV